MTAPSSMKKQPSLANSKSQKRPTTVESHEMRDSLFQFKNKTVEFNTTKFSFGNKAEAGFNPDQRILKGGGKIGQCLF